MKSTQSMIDLRSDTVTRPNPAMRAAMAEAEVGDDVYGEDPTVNKLERMVAELTGKEAAIYVPSGTMGNQIALNLHCQHGDSVLAEDESHCFLYEAGAAAALSGIQFELIPLEAHWDLQHAEARLRGDWMHYATTRLVVIENTHNRCAGRVLSAEKISEIATWARHHGLAMHCDGARIWNAAVALGTTEKELLRDFDSASVCLSKGLGAPVGSALVGSQSFIDRARKIRKRWGGGMRQSGILAAAAIYALKNQYSDIRHDHQKAQFFHDALLTQSGTERIEVRFPQPNTNMVYLRSRTLSGETIVQKLKSQGILVNGLGQNWVRVVTHRDVSMSDMEVAVSAFLSAFKADC
jgi:threonine aldolase